MTRVVLIAGCLLMTPSCDTTGGELITLPFNIGGIDGHDAGTPLTFITNQNWLVELDEARVALGPFYFNIQPPETGTLRSGVVIMEVTTQVIIDAVDPTLHGVDGGADGETGHAISVEIDLLPLDGTQSQADQDAFETASALVAGTAFQVLPDGGTHVLADGGSGLIVPFTGAITVNKKKVTDDFPLTAVERIGGAGCDLEFGAAPAQLVGRVDPGPWFDGVDFSTLIPPLPKCPDGGMGCGRAWTPDAGALTWSPTSGFNALLWTGLQAQTGSYIFSLADGGQ